MKQLEPHPLADLVPPMTEEEYQALKADIEANGLRDPIVLYQRKILEGRHRYRALQELDLIDEKQVKRFLAGKARGRWEQFIVRKFPDDAAAAAYVLSKNIHRRHLTSKDKRDTIAKLLAYDPSKSDRQIAKQLKVDHHKVAEVRKEEEDVGKIPHVETRTDTKGRKQPAKKAKKKGAAERRRERDKAKRERVMAEALAEWEAAKAVAKQLAQDLLKVLDRDLARRLHDQLREGISPEIREVLAEGLGITESNDAAPRPEKISPSHDGENASDPEIAAEDMKAKFAAMDGNDPGPIPESLRRQP